MSLVRFRSEAPKTEVLKKSSAYAAVAHLVERHLAKVEVASSSLVGRSIGSEISLPSWWRGQVVRQRSAKPLFTSSNLVATSKTALDFGPGLFCFCLCKHKTRPGMLSTSSVLFIPRYNSSCPFSFERSNALSACFSASSRLSPITAGVSPTEIPVSSRSCFAQAATYITASLSQEWL